MSVLLFAAMSDRFSYYFWHIYPNVMIQRIQTVFLLAVIIAGIVLLFLPLYTWIDPQGKPVSENILAHAAFGALTALITVLAAAAVFMYSNRPLQSRIALGGALLSVVTFVLVFLFAKEIAGLPEATVVKTEPGTWLYLVMDFMFIAAFIFIRKDEQLVRSADRIR